jgi:hypothetical protein
MEVGGSAGMVDSTMAVGAVDGAGAPPDWGRQALIRKTSANRVIKRLRCKIFLLWSRKFRIKIDYISLSWRVV